MNRRWLSLQPGFTAGEHDLIRAQGGLIALANASDGGFSLAWPDGSRRFLDALLAAEAAEPEDAVDAAISAFFDGCPSDDPWAEPYLTFSAAWCAPEGVRLAHVGPALVRLHTARGLICLPSDPERFVQVGARRFWRTCTRDTRELVWEKVPGPVSAVELLSVATADQAAWEPLPEALAVLDQPFAAAIRWEAP